MAAPDTLIVPDVMVAITAILTEGSRSHIYRRRGLGASHFRFPERPVVAWSATTICSDNFDFARFSPGQTYPVPTLRPTLLFGRQGSALPSR
jgi:hypothetical protein